MNVHATTGATPQLPSGLNESETKALAAINRFVSDPPDNTRVFWINPIMAQYLLDRYNLANRAKKPGKITEYSSAMKAGDWKLTGDTLKFSDRGLLRDGQNRLMACVASGMPFQTHVVFGIDDDFFRVMDQGKNRGGADLLHIAGVKNSGIVSPAVRWAHLFESKTVPQRTTFTPTELFDMYNSTYSDVSNFVSAAEAIKRVLHYPAGFMAGGLYHLSQVDAVAAAEVGKALANNNLTGKFFAFERMRFRLKELSDAAQGRVHDTVRAALLIIAWNLYRDGRKGTKKDFEWDISKPFPEAL